MRPALYTRYGAVVHAVDQCLETIEKGIVLEFALLLDVGQKLNDPIENGIALVNDLIQNGCHRIAHEFVGEFELKEGDRYIVHGFFIVGGCNGQPFAHERQHLLDDFLFAGTFVLLALFRLLCLRFDKNRILGQDVVGG